MEMTPERFKCLRVIEQHHGRMSHEDDALKPFCDDASTLTTPDVFNQCHDAGWLLSGHDDRNDSSTVRLTAEGREALANARSQRISDLEAVVREIAAQPHYTIGGDPDRIFNSLHKRYTHIVTLAEKANVGALSDGE